MDNFLEIISSANKLSNQRSKNSINVKIFTNSIVNPIDKIIKFNISEKGIRSHIEYAEFNTILPSKNKNRYNVGLFFWECENLFPNGYEDLEKYNLKERKSVINNFINNFEYFLEDENKFDYFIFKKLNSNNYLSGNFSSNNAQFISNEINSYIENKSKTIKKIILFDDQDLAFKYGNNYFERKLKKSKMPYYSADALIEIGKSISAMILSHYGLSKKVFILDCDNTMWNGVIGEDDNKMFFSNKDTKKDYFLYLNTFLKRLKAKGVLLAICSKNNFNDVKKFFKKNKKYLLDFDDFIAKKINWELKSKNILEISKELKLGTGSFIFLDDSKHEINEVKTAIKDIDCFLVPQNLEDYKKTLMNIYKYFNYSTFNTGEDSKRTLLYQQEKQRDKIKSKYSYNDYLKNLKLEMTFGDGKKFNFNRLVQMTQKTNQFNLTILRQNEQEFQRKLLSNKYVIYAFSLKDKFGDYGTVGLCQIKIVNKNTALIENFLMSCRVLGRNAEQTFLHEILKNLIKMKIKQIYGLFSKGPKNKIVKNFYKENGFSKKSNKNLKYNGELYSYNTKTEINTLKIIKIKYGT